LPGGDEILATDDAHGLPLRPAIVSADGSLVKRLDALNAPDLNLGCGNASPDRSRLVLEGFSGDDALDGIYTVDAADGGGLDRLTTGADGVPQYSPDGELITFFRTKAGVHPDGAGAVFVMSATGANVHRVTPWGRAFVGERWSPNGEWIVFEEPYGRIAMVHPDGSDLHAVPVALPVGTGAIQPSWSPDGRWIVFALQRGQRSTIYAVHPDGTGLQPVTEPSGTIQSIPDWGP
jgi:TolB protein